MVIPDPLHQVLLLFAEALATAALLLIFLRLRRTFGLALVYITQGVLFYVSNLLAAAVYVQVGPTILVSPGSVVFFPAVLLVVLFVYIKEDAFEARRLIYGLLAANVTISLMGFFTTMHLMSPGAVNPFKLAPELFVQTPRIAIVGSLVLFVDTIIIILVYEALARVLVNRLFMAIWVSMTGVLVFDQVVFVTGCFVEKPFYTAILVSGLVGKVAAALFYSAALALYLRRFDMVEAPRPEERQALGRVFQLLTYRQKYEALRNRFARDPLTGVYSRGFFDEILPSQLAAARRNQRALTLLMIDLDHFKRINDTYGHSAGDQVLRDVAAAFAATVRASDYVCRYGGEEFAVVLPETDVAEGLALAGRIRSAVAARFRTREHRGPGAQLTITIGAAAFPAEAGSVEALVDLADARLYQGKAAGRDRIVPSPAPRRVLAGDIADEGVV
jgi:diguanylate cyclase (GGDEF)-like protein